MKLIAIYLSESLKYNKANLAIMKQSQLIREASKKTVYSIWELNIVFNIFIETIKQALESGETVISSRLAHFR